MSDPFPRLVLLVSTLALLVGRVPAGGEEPASPDVTEPPASERFIVVPLRAHILTATDLPEVDCHLSDPDIRRILGKVNGIWHQAGVHWGLESILREPAARQEKFRLARSLNGDDRPNLNLFRLLLPEATRDFDGLHVYYLHKFPVNGVWLGEDYAIVQETASLRAVEGGLDEPIPRVTAHELGHALGLSHRQDRVNLLASGTTGTRLNAREVETARRNAETIKGAATVAVLRSRAERALKEDDLVKARRLWTWLAEVPGDASAEARRRLAEPPLREPPVAKP